MENTTANFITTLPDSLILLVFKYLSLDDICLSVRLTCKRWYELSFDFVLWKHITLQEKGTFLTDKDLVQLLCQVGKNVEHLVIDNCLKISCLAFLSTKLQCPKLKYLSVRGTQIKNAGMTEILCNTEKFPCLTDVRFEVSPVNKFRDLSNFYSACASAYRSGRNLKSIYDPYEDCLDAPPEDLNNGLLKIAALYNDLESLTVNNKVLNGIVLEEICKSNPNIDTISISQCQWVSDNLENVSSYLKGIKKLDISFTPVSDKQLVRLVKKHTELTSLNITGCRKITDIGIGELAENCSGLISLTLNDGMLTSGTVMNAGLQSIAKHCKALKEIKLVFCPGITDEGIIALAEKCIELETIEITGSLRVTDSSFHAISNNCRKLKMLKASECIKITKSGVNEIIKKCSQLNHLELETCHYLSDLKFINDSDLRKVNVEKSYPVDNCNLHYYDIFTTLVASPCRVQVIDLNFCSNIGTESVIQIALYCSTLRNLSLRGCFLLTDTAIKCIAERCKLLNILDISGSPSNHSSLTDDSLQALSKFSKNLVMLSVSKNQVITNNGLKDIIIHCKTLRRLNFDAGKGLQVISIVEEVKKQRKICHLQGMNIDYLHENTKGNVILKFPSFHRPV